MNSYFDGYINSKTTLKQFVEQYENALARKVDNEKNEDTKSSQSYIPCIIEDGIENQFQNAYTNAKAREFQGEFVGKLKCSYEKKIKDDVWLEYEVKEWITYREERKRKRVSFTVDFNGETNEANCNCRLFESKGMVCRHQLIVFHDRGIQRVLDKYVLRRWRKDVKRVHTKIRINYDNSSRKIEARRYDNMCNLFTKVADLAEDCQEKYAKEVEEIADAHIFGTQESVGNVNSCYMGQFMWPNIMSHNMRPTMAQGGAILPVLQVCHKAEPSSQIWHKAESSSQI
ncbi:hypothetical protein RHMOL_Rhmol08G0235600 [Rhododendron molle]|uniref:Uncharacterized protein n=1 Tax=Rhododendron molle TaxID=49168 RepID=A0ACC0MRK1_RHOML|nr:hypothetical protein RHMOL_Rhmol08G0235600 [Rhododendron molle]